jgi:glutaredoxin
MKVVRYIVGRIVLFLNFITRPALGVRSEHKQEEVEAQLSTYSLYQFEACPFCVKVRRAMRRLNLPIELRDAKSNEVHKKELLALGGSPKVPCLRIGDTWVYESDDIVNYLDQHFAIQ